MDSGLKYKFWKCSVDGFPRSIINYENDFCHLSINDCVSKILHYNFEKNTKTATRRDEKSIGNETKIMAVAIEYYEKLKEYKEYKSFEQFITLCEKNEGFFIGLQKDTIKYLKEQIIRNELSWSLIMILSKVLNHLQMNFELLNIEIDILYELAIMLRINIVLNDKVYTSSSNAFFFFDE